MFTGIMEGIGIVGAGTGPPAGAIFTVKLSVALQSGTAPPVAAPTVATIKY